MIPKRRFTRRRMAPHMGRVSSPIDVRSPSDIPKALQRLAKGPVTIVFVYADWCGHCQRFKPMFQKAVKTPRRDTEIVSVKDDMLENFNNELVKKIPSAAPLEPEGYPDVVIVDNKGSNIGSIPSSASEEDIVSVVSNGANMVKTPASNAANAANNSRRNNAANNAANNSRRNNAANNSYEPEPEPTPTPLSNAANNSRRNASNTSTVPVSNAPVVSSKSMKNANSLDVGAENTTPMSGPVMPPAATEDVVVSAEELEPKQAGGSLFGSLSSAAYTLAPAGVLLAGLHALRRKSRKHKGGKRKARKTARRHK